MDLPATVAPHILRGVSLLGIDSVMAPAAKRDSAWKTLAKHLDKAQLGRIARIEPMSSLPELAEDIVAGRIRGRVVIDVSR